MKTTLKKHLVKNPLIVNSLSLMLATGVSALFGFIFWVLVARSFTPVSVGLATTLLSISGFISLLGLTGFDTVFMRYLAKSRHRSQQINSGFIITACTSAMFAGLFCAVIPMLSPKLIFVNHTFWYSIGFIVITIFGSWVTLTNAALIAFRKTIFILITNTVFSVLKIGLVFSIHSGGPVKIFFVVGVAQIISLLLNVTVLVKYFSYIPSLRLSLSIVRETLRFGLTTYAANILNLLPDSILPLIVINTLGSISAAYFYVAFTIANLLYTIAFSASQAMLAEASHDEAHMLQHISKGSRLVLSLMVVGILVVAISCPFVLELFGHSYRYGATNLLRIMAFSGIFVTIYAIMYTIFNVTKNLNAMLAMTLINALSIIGLSLLFSNWYGLVGIGWAWLVGSMIAVCVGLPFMQQSLRNYNAR